MRRKNPEIRSGMFSYRLSKELKIYLYDLDILFSSLWIVGWGPAMRAHMYIVAKFKPMQEHSDLKTF